MVKIIAEIGINHQGDMEKAKRMIVLSKMAGADTAKFQWYDPLEVLGRDNPYIEEAKRAQFSESQHQELKEYCDWAGIEWAVSIFHPEHVAAAERIGQKFYKVASRAALDIRLLKEISKTGKPVVLSAGLIIGLLPDLRRKLQAIRDVFAGNHLTLMHCICEYPTKLKTILMGRMSVLAGFADAVGFSSHCPSISPTLLAICQGAKTVENHVVIDKSQQGCDVSSSLTFQQFSEMCVLIRELEEIA